MLAYLVSDTTPPGARRLQKQIWICKCWKSLDGEEGHCSGERTEDRCPAPKVEEWNEWEEQPGWPKHSRCALHLSCWTLGHVRSKPSWSSQLVSPKTRPVISKLLMNLLRVLAYDVVFQTMLLTATLCTICLPAYLQMDHRAHPFVGRVATAMKSSRTTMNILRNPEFNLFVQRHLLYRDLGGVPLGRWPSRKRW
ncbi:hypothetical protein DENSPDRAFT_263697 [Dentipellis sp. KUC8613]|nr:hypothetical protein DENSPDRAFT_263697 [Dentipellis sp. KUC8613]